MKTSTILLRNERLGSFLLWLPKESFAFTQAFLNFIWTHRSGGLLPPKALLTFHSKAPTAIPEDAPFPARPMKWPVPIFEAKRKAPIWKSKDNYKKKKKTITDQNSYPTPKTNFHKRNLKLNFTFPQKRVHLGRIPICPFSILKPHHKPEAK